MSKVCYVFFTLKPIVLFLWKFDKIGFEVAMTTFLVDVFQK